MIKSTAMLCGLLLTAASLAQVQPTTAPAFVVGVNTHFSQRKGVLPDNIALIRAAGANGFRDEVPWSQVEREKGQYVFPERMDAAIDAARAAGMEVVIPLGYGNRFYESGGKPVTAEGLAGYAAYCRFVVTHLRGRVKHYEVWNEYNIGIGTPKAVLGTPENYVRMLAVAAQMIRAADPNAVVIGGVTAPSSGTNDPAVPGGIAPGGWFDRACAGGLVKHCDAVSVHTYNYRMPGERRTPEAWTAIVTRIESIVAKHADGRRVPLLITEHGWPTHVGPGGTTLPTAADYLARCYLLARTLPTVQGLWWYDFQDDGPNAADPEDVFGLVTTDLTPKPAHFALRDVAGLVATAKYDGRLDAGEDAHLLRFVRPDGRTTLAGWSTLAAPGNVQVVLRADGDTANLTATLTTVGRGSVTRRLVHRDWPGQAAKAVEEPNRLAVTLTQTPVLIDAPVPLRVERVSRRPATRPSATGPATQSGGAG